MADYRRRFRIVDCLIDRTDMLRAAKTVLDRIATGEGGYVCFCNVHMTVTARKDAHLRRIIDDSLLSVPDGKPLSIVARWRGYTDVDRVAGPDFLPHMLRSAPGLRHFFFGSTPETLASLVANLKARYPDAVIAGGHSPPFRPLTAEETRDTLRRIHAARPDIVWIGLGAPKQEYWMAQHWRALRPAVLMGVGAAFDFHAGRIPRAPAWMHRLSLEWLYRLYREPRRLWKRYLLTNTAFIYHVLKNLLAGKDRGDSSPRGNASCS